MVLPIKAAIIMIKKIANIGKMIVLMLLATTLIKAWTSITSLRLSDNKRFIMVDKASTKALPITIMAKALPTNTNMVPKSLERAI